MENPATYGDGWELRLGDCLDPVTGLASLGDKSVDHVITDPPYSRFTHGKNRGNELGGMAALTPIEFSEVTEEQRAGLCRESFRVSRRWSLVWSDAEGITPWVESVEASGLEHVRVGFWVKEGASPQFSGDRPGTGAEALLIGHRPGRKKWNGGGRVGIWTFPVLGQARETRVHTTQKPLALMEALVRDFTDPGELVCDPFAGSGTTGVACIRLGRRFIGWERDPKYHAVAVKRLRAAREQLGLWTGAA